jgi:hypothetical protein
MFLGLTNMESMREATINMLVFTFHLLGGKLGVLLSHHKVLNRMGSRLRL